MKVVWKNEKLRFQCETEEDYDPQQTLQRMIDALERETERIKTEAPLSESDSAAGEQSQGTALGS